MYLESVESTIGQNPFCFSVKNCSLRFDQHSRKHASIFIKSLVGKGEVVQSVQNKVGTVYFSPFRLEVQKYSPAFSSGFTEYWTGCK